MLMLDVLLTLRTSAGREDARIPCAVGHLGTYLEESEAQDLSRQRKQKDLQNRRLMRRLQMRTVKMSTTPQPARYHFRHQKRMRRPNLNLYPRIQSRTLGNDSVEDGEASCRGQAKKHQHHRLPSSTNPSILEHLLLRSSIKPRRPSPQIQPPPQLHSLQTRHSVVNSKQRSSSRSSRNSRLEHSFTASISISRIVFSTRGN